MQKITIAPTKRDTVVGIAAPATPHFSPKIHIALPVMLIALISREIHMVTLALFMERNIAAQEL